MFDSILDLSLLSFGIGVASGSECTYNVTVSVVVAPRLTIFFYIEGIHQF